MLVFEVAGVRVEVVAPAPLLAPVLGRWGAMATQRGPHALTIRWTVDARGDAFELRRDGELIDAGPEVDARAMLELDVYREVAYASAATPLHAAALASGGRALLLAGASGAGKSSLALALARRDDWVYLGDEHAFVDDDLRVVGLARAVRIGEEDARTSPPTVGGAQPLALVVLLETPRTATGEARVVPAALAAARLVEALHRRPGAEDVRRVTALASRVPVLALARSGVEAARDAVLAAWARV